MIPGVSDAQSQRRSDYSRSVGRSGGFVLTWFSDTGRLRSSTTDPGIRGYHGRIKPDDKVPSNSESALAGSQSPLERHGVRHTRLDAV